MMVIRLPLLSVATAAVFAAGLSVSFSAPAQAISETVQTTRSVIRAGTPEHLKIARFLGATRLNPSVVGSQVYDLRASKGNFYVTLTQRISSKASGVTAPSPPTDLPDFANPGDTYKISHCTQGNQQEWSFTWAQITPGKWGWVTMSYSTTYVRVCSIEPGPG
jgi:hypothetical protein